MPEENTPVPFCSREGPARAFTPHLGLGMMCGMWAGAPGLGSGVPLLSIRPSSQGAKQCLSPGRLLAEGQETEHMSGEPKQRYI